MAAPGGSLADLQSMHGGSLASCHRFGGLILQRHAQRARRPLNVLKGPCPFSQRTFRSSRQLLQLECAVRVPTAGPPLLDQSSPPSSFPSRITRGGDDGSAARGLVARRASQLHATTSRTVEAAATGQQQQGSPLEASSASSEERVRRLQVLVQLRKLYRNMIRANSLLEQSSPVYSHAEAKEALEGTSEENAEAMAKEQIDRAVEVVAEMQLTSDQLSDSVRKLNKARSGFHSVFDGRSGAAGVDRGGGSRQPAGGSGTSAEQQQAVRQAAIRAADELQARARREIGQLPFTSRVVAQAALDARNARFRPEQALRSMNEEDSGAPGATEMEAWDRQRSAAIERLEQAEKVAGSVAKRLPGAVQKVRKLPPKDVLAGVRRGAFYARGLWVRLNGGGKSDFGQLRLPAELPLPTSTKEGQARRVAELTARVEALEKKLQEASKARESRLRKAGLPARARMAAELRDMDTDILTLTRTLAVATLQLEMEFIYGSLEEEVLDIAPESLTLSPTGVLARSGTSDEAALLVAEFAPLDVELAAMSDAVARGEAGLIQEDELDRLATEIPDMRTRLGIRDDQVFAGSKLSLVKMELQLQEGIAKVGEAAKFFSRGTRLLVSDVGNSGRLFMKAAFGGTLKPREVRGIRQTVKDIIVVVPFTIILIAPITPVGHVLVFGFLQRYFPGFFPSQFSGRRQAQMIKRQALQAALTEAQEAALAEVDEAEFARASAAVSRLTEVFSPQRVLQPSIADQPANGAAEGWRDGRGVDSDAGDEDVAAEGPATRKLRNLEAQVAQAEADSFGSDGEEDDEAETGRPGR